MTTSTDLMLSTTKIIMEACSAQEIVEKFNTLFKEELGILKMDFLTFDYNVGMFRDFVRDWIYVEDPDRQKIVYAVFNSFKQTHEKFILNGHLFPYSPEDNELDELINSSNREVNLLYFPLFSTDRVFGLVEVQYNNLKEDIVVDKDFLKIIQIIMLQITTAVYNFVIKEHMATGLNFYDAMKNIAKIIESQYELEYIVPQIGEMVDRFISSHLIYIFLKDEEQKFKLLWPANCNNEEIISMLEKTANNDKVLISQDRRVGIFPIKGEGVVLGSLAAYSTIGKLSANEIEYLVELTKQSGITIQRANVYSEVLKHATLDALTGLNNRRQFEIRLKQETSQSQRKETDLCCIMLDIDYFKRVNDTYGHSAGDCVLKGVAEVLTKTLREYDIPCRYGGEEFFVLLPMTGLDDTIAVAQRLRSNIEHSKIDVREARVKGITHLQVTVSIGVNKYNHSQTAEEFYQGADKALYDAKVGGRNKVVVYEGGSTQKENR